MTIVGIREVRLLNERGIAHRYEEFPDNHTGSTNAISPPES